MADFAPGIVFAGHRIDAVAGRGGMGVVYRATQLALDRTVALKVIAPSLVEDDASVQRFVRESKLAASIDHPNVIPIYYAGEEDGVAFIAMRYVAGDDVRSLVRREGPLAPERAARIVAQVGAALDAAHAAGLVHRDVKPANVLLGQDDHVYLTDFGLTKHALSNSGHTNTGHWVGTLDYVAPEQIRAQRVDARSDVYALGCVLYFTLTGKVPFDRPNDEARLWAHLTEPPPRLADAGIQGPAGFDEVFDRALAKSPEERYPSAGDLGRAALAAARGEACPTPERTVAVGPAAPDEAPTVDAPVPPTAITQLAEEGAQPAARSGSRGALPVHRAGRRGALAALLSLLSVAGIVGVVLAMSGDEPAPRASAKATPTATPPPSGPDARVADTVRNVGRRPNGIAVAGRTVWVVSFLRDRLTRVVDGKVRSGPEIGRGGSDLLAENKQLYVTVSRGRRVLRLDPRTGRKRAELANLPGQPARLDRGEGGLWVVERTMLPSTPDHLLKLDPVTLTVKLRIPMQDGLRAVATGGGAIWVAHRRIGAVSKVSARTGAILKTINVGSDPEDLSYADGRVWVANAGDDTVTRIDTRTGRTLALDVPRGPARIEARGGDVWVTSRLESTVTRMNARDPRRSRDDEPLDVGLEAYGVAVTGSRVWVTGVADNTLTRIDYS